MKNQTYALFKKYGPQDCFFGAPGSSRGISKLPKLVEKAIAYMPVIIIAILCLLTIDLHAGLMTTGAACAVLPLVGMRFFEPEGKGGGGGINLDPDQAKDVIEGVKNLRTDLGKVKSAQETLLADVTRLNGETKSALDDLTKVKNTCNDVATLSASIKRLEVSLKRESRMAYGSPVARISADPELRARFNAAVRMAVSKNGDTDEVVKQITKALGEDSSPGSTMISTGLAKEIYDTLATYGVWNTFGVRRMGTKLTSFPVKTARPVANVILTEGGTISDDETKAGTSVNLEVEVIAALLNVSRQVLTDAEFDVTADVMNDFVEAFNYRLDFLALRSDSTADATNGGMTGAFVGGTAAVAASTHTTVGSLDLADFIKVLATVDSAVLARSPKWWIHPTLLAKVGGIKDGNGRPLFQTALEAPAPGAIGTILGFPVVLANVAPTTDSASAKVAVFGDPNALVVGIREDFVFESSDEFRWNTLERSFRGYGRAGVKIRRATGLAVLTTAAS